MTAGLISYVSTGIVYFLSKWWWTNSFTLLPAPLTGKLLLHIFKHSLEVGISLLSRPSPQPLLIDVLPRICGVT